MRRQVQPLATPYARTHDEKRLIEMNRT